MRKKIPEDLDAHRKGTKKKPDPFIDDMKQALRSLYYEVPYSIEDWISMAKKRGVMGLSPTDAVKKDPSFYRLFMKWAKSQPDNYREIRSKIFPSKAYLKHNSPKIKTSDTQSLRRQTSHKSTYAPRLFTTRDLQCSGDEE